MFYARRAYLNNERLTETARIRIVEVASHHTGDKKEILTRLVQGSLGAFYKYLSSYVSKYSTDLDNRLT